MASNARVSNKQGAQGKQKLRVIATAAAGCGIFMNIIALIAIAKDRRFGGSKRLLSGAFVPLVASLTWNLIGLASGSFSKQKLHLQAFGDMLAFFTFLAMLIVNDVEVNHIGRYGRLRMDHITLLAYNSVPWMLCAAMHICLAQYTILAKLSSFIQLPKIKIEWPNKPAGSGRTLIAGNEDSYSDDVEARRESTDVKRQGYEEAEPLLGSS